jgi:hypothetical protein
MDLQWNWPIRSFVTRQGSRQTNGAVKNRKLIESLENHLSTNFRVPLLFYLSERNRQGSQGPQQKNVNLRDNQPIVKSPKAITELVPIWLNPDYGKLRRWYASNPMIQRCCVIGFGYLDWRIGRGMDGKSVHLDCCRSHYFSYSGKQLH